MSFALSEDLRIRVVEFVESGASHRQAAARFGVSAASVSRWRALKRRQGNLDHGPLGGDRRSGPIEAQHDLILSLIAETPDITIREIQDGLAEKGHVFSHSAVHRFLQRHRITRKKRRPMRKSRNGPMS